MASHDWAIRKPQFSEQLRSNSRNWWEPTSNTQRAPGLKNSISRGDIEKLKLSMQNEIFNREWNVHSGPLSGRRKTGPGIEIFNREWHFQTENEISSENENFVRGGMAFFHAFEREWMFLIPALWLFSFAHAFSERLLKNWVGPRALEKKVQRTAIMKWNCASLGAPPPWSSLWLALLVWLHLSFRNFPVFSTILCLFVLQGPQRPSGQKTHNVRDKTLPNLVASNLGKVVFVACLKKRSWHFPEFGVQFFFLAFWAQNLAYAKFGAPTHLLSKVAGPTNTRRKFLTALRKSLT